MKAATMSMSRARGLWLAEANSPVLVSDPDKARALFGLPARTKRATKQLEACVLPLSFVRRHLPTLTPRVRREVERLLSGSRKLWRDEFHNEVVQQGLNDLLDVTLSSATQDTTWFIGLTDGTPTTAPGNTLASHAGWAEITDFDEITRVAYVDAGASGESLTNAASPAEFTINATVTIGGAFLAGVNTGTAGRLYAVGAFTLGDKGLSDNDVLDVTAQFSMATA